MNNKYRIDYKSSNFSNIISKLNEHGFIHIKNALPNDNLKSLDKNLISNHNLLRDLLGIPINILPLCFSDNTSSSFENPIAFSKMKKEWYFNEDKQFKKWFWKNGNKFPNSLLKILLKHKIIDLLRQFFNSEILTSYGLNSLRIIDEYSENNFSNIHQDMTYFSRSIEDHNFITVWIPFNNCGIDSPSLKILKENVYNVLPCDKELSNRCIDKSYSEKLKIKDFYSPSYEIGDLVLFKSLKVHGTHLNPNMVKSRRSADLRFFSKLKQPRVLDRIDDDKIFL